MEYIIVVVLLIFSALFSGLTLGLMGMRLDELKRKKELGDVRAASVHRVRAQGNLLLTTLLVGNVAVNAVLSIFLGSITTGVIAAIIATVLIVIFGEIIPQALFHRYALELGSRVTWLVQFLIWILYPITKPIALTLDKLLGDELPSIYSKKELVKIIEEHEDDPLSAVDEDEERIVKGALTFSDMKVREVMTPKEGVIGFSANEVVTKGTLKKAVESSKTRFPVFDEEGHPCGILFLAKLVGDANLGKSVWDVARKDFISVDQSGKLDKALETFIRSQRHICMVLEEGRFVGIITLHDVLQEILKTEMENIED